jgi:sigma-B regulation protein RsbQ
MRQAVRDRLHITESGDGERALVLANGFGTTQSVWASITPWLEERFRVIRFDWPVEPQHYDHTRYGEIDAYAEDLLGVIVEMAASPCVLIGHSMSGMISMLAGSAKPSAFERIVMINPSPRYINDEGYVGGFSPEEVSTLIGSLSRNYFGWVAGFAPSAAGPEVERWQIEEFVRGLRAMRPDVAMSMATTLFGSDLRQRLSRFTVPTAIIQSTHDPIVPVDVSRFLHQQWPNSRVLLMEMEGHLPHLTHAPLLLEALDQILYGMPSPNPRLIDA